MDGPLAYRSGDMKQSQEYVVKQKKKLFTESAWKQD